MTSGNLLTTDAEALRRTIGRFRLTLVVLAVAFGLPLLAYGLGWLEGVGLSTDTTGSELLVFGAVFLFACGGFGWILFGRAAHRGARSLVVTPEGVRAEIGQQLPVEIRWSDPAFRGELTATTSGPSGSIFLKLDGADGHLTARITGPGAALLRRAAAEQGLQIQTESRPGSPSTMEVIRFRSDPEDPSPR